VTGPAARSISAPGDAQVKPEKPQWEFGHGLSYTTFAVNNLKLGSTVFKGGGELAFSVEVSHTGKPSGKEIVEPYTSDLHDSLTPPLKRLRAFTKVEPGRVETRTLEFQLRAADFAFVNAQSHLVTEPGEFAVMVGGLEAKLRFEE
jgi:beta-glucosidase